MAATSSENGRMVLQAALVIVLSAGVIGMWKNNGDLAELKADVRNISERLDYLSISFNGRLRSMEVEMMSGPPDPHD